MARHVAVSVVVEPLDHDLGHWCRRCLLGSGIRQWVVVRLADRMHMQIRVWCGDCGSRDVIIERRSGAGL